VKRWRWLLIPLVVVALLGVGVIYVLEMRGGSGFAR
jgi:hypothetical protein